MSFLKSLKPNKPTASLEGYFISMLAKSKFGKTTFAIDLANEFYGGLDSTLILAPEIGYKTMNGVYAINITGFDYAEDEDNENERGFIETVDELIENKSDHSFRFIIIDTITALERYAVAYAVRKANRDDQPAKRYTDISDIPWGKGYTLVAEYIYSQIDRLKKAGFGVFIIGHEKTKKITNKDGFEYDYTMFNVLGKTADIIEREADMIIYGDLMVEEGEDGKAVESRKLRFRSDGNILCGTRFRNFPAVIDNDVHTFISTFKEAVLGLYNNDEKAVKKAQKEQKIESEAKSEKAVKKEKDSGAIDDLKEEIKSLLDKMDKADKVECAKFFKKKLGEGGDYRKSEDLEGLKEALEFTKSL
jgi:AAA domain